MFHIKHSALIKHFSTQQNNQARTLAAVPNRITNLNQCLCCRPLEASLREGSGFPPEHSRAPDDLFHGYRGERENLHSIYMLLHIVRLAEKNLKQELLEWSLAGFKQIKGWKFSMQKFSKRNSWQNFQIVRHRPKSVIFIVTVSSATQKKQHIPRQDGNLQATSCAVRTP